jgi:hypothetical protein
VQVSFRANQAFSSVDAEVKQLVHEVDHSPPSADEVIQKSCMFSLCMPSWHGKIYLFHLYCIGKIISVGKFSAKYSVCQNT